MNVGWQALRDKQIAVVCRSPEECEAFLREAYNQQISMRRQWLKDIRYSARSHWKHTEYDPEDWYGVAYGFSEYEDLGFCWPEWWTDRDHRLVDFGDFMGLPIGTIDDLI